MRVSTNQAQVAPGHSRQQTLGLAKELDDATQASNDWRWGEDQGHMIEGGAVGVQTCTRMISA